MAKYIPQHERANVTIVEGPWPAGINNRQPDHALPTGTLRNAVNADMDPSGHVRRRDGYTKVVAVAASFLVVVFLIAIVMLLLGSGVGLGCN